MVCDGYESCWVLQTLEGLRAISRGLAQVAYTYPVSQTCYWLVFHSELTVGRRVQIGFGQLKTADIMASVGGAWKVKVR